MVRLMSSNFRKLISRSPADDEVLVRAHAASLNILDWYGISGLALGRIGAGCADQDPRVGVDFAGVVEGVGANVKLFRPGDEVYGGRMVFRRVRDDPQQRGIAETSQGHV